MKNLKKWREARGMSQKFVAISLSVAPPQISKWENETTEPSIENLIKLAKLYQVTTDDLLGLTSAVKGISDEEKDLLLAYRRATADTRRAVRAVLSVPETEEKSAAI